MSLRVQASLIFNDEELYNGLIIPYKESKELNKLLINCLTAYYYDAECRKKIDEINGIQTFQNNDSLMESIQNIRNTLAIQDYTVKELQNQMEEGISDFSDILSNANKMAEEAGFAKTEKTESGERVLRVEMKNQESTSSQDSTKGSPISVESEFILQMLLRVFKNSGDTEGANIISSRLAGSTQTENKDAVNTSSESVETKVLSGNDEEIDIFSEDSSNSDVISESTTVDTSSFDESASNEDATASLLEAWNSL